MPIETIHVCDYCGYREHSYSSHFSTVDLVVKDHGANAGNTTHDLGFMCQRCAKAVKECLDAKLAQLADVSVDSSDPK